MVNNQSINRQHDPSAGLNWSVGNLTFFRLLQYQAHLKSKIHVWITGLWQNISEERVPKRGSHPGLGHQVFSSSMTQTWRFARKNFCPVEIFDKNFSDFAFRVFEKEPEGSWERETAVSNQATLLQVSLQFFTFTFSNSFTFLFLFYSFLNIALSKSDLAICFTFLFYFSFIAPQVL